MLGRLGADNSCSMDRVSRPLIGLLVATVAFFALWVTMLKPSSPTSGANAGNIAKNPSLGQLSGAIAAAHAAVATSNRAAGRSGGTVVSASITASATHPTAPASPLTRVSTKHVSAVRPVVRVHTAAHPRTHAPHRAHVVRAAPHLTAAGRLRLATRALVAHKVLALLFFNPSAADDRAVDRELALVPVHRGAVVKLAVPLAEVASYASLAAQAPISTSPTLLIVDRTRNATELVGFADRFEIAQRVTDALAVK
jgi:hypothetical protein